MQNIAHCRSTQSSLRVPEKRFRNLRFLFRVFLALAAFAVAVSLPLSGFGQNAPDEPDAPDAGGNEGGESNPTGVSGIFNGNVTTGCSYDPTTRNALRVIDDIVVPGCVGAYPLKWTRYNNNRMKYGNNGGWTFSYDYWQSNTKFYYPDGRTMDLTGESMSSGVEDELEQDSIDPFQYTLYMADGGRVIMLFNRATKIIDPYGHETLIERDAAHNNRITKVTEPGGRYLQVIWGGSQINYVRAYTGGPNNQLIETVDYSWGQSINHVGYDDGTFADYTYEPTGGDNQQRLLLKTAQDVRYNGPMRQIEYDHSGTALVREKKLSGEYVSTLQPHDGPQITELRGDGATRHFVYGDQDHGGWGAIGKLTDYTDFQNHHTIIDYEPTNGTWFGFIKKVTDANGHSTSYTRQANSWGITRITHDVDGSHIDQTFWPNNSQTQPYYLASRTDELDHTTTYTRNDPANPNDPLNDPLNPYSIRRKDYADGSYETFTYNGFGQVVTHSRTKTLSPLVLETESFTYDTRGLKTKYTDPFLKETIYTYYAANDPVAGNAWIDRLKTVTRAMNISGQTQTETYEYDRRFVSGVDTGTPCGGRGLVTKVKHTDGSGITTTHNQWGDVRTVTDELNHTTTNTYDDYGRVLTTTTPAEYPEDPLNHTTVFDYKPDTQTNSYVTTSKLPWLITSPGGKKTKTIYDANWRKTQVQVGFNTSDQATTKFYYDTYGGYTSIGNLLATEDPRNPSYVTRYHYDIRDRQDQVTDALGASLGDANHTTSFTFDYRGNKLTETHPNTPQGALFIEYDGYDLMNRLTHKKVHRDATHTDQTSMAYDAAGNLTSSTNENGHIYSYAYDLMNRRTSMIYPDTSKHEDTAYDDAGNIKTYTNRNGKIQTFGYDNRNRQTSFYWNDNNVTPAQSMAYDAASRATQMVRWYSSRSGSYYCTINLAYYDDNKLKSEEEWTDAFSDNVHRTVTYTYDADGNRQTVQYPSGTSFTYGYTNRNQLDTIKSTGQQSAIVDYGYDLSGNVITRTLDNGTTSTYTVDQISRETTIVHNVVGGPAKQFDYSYNNVSDITAVKRDSGTGDGFLYDRTQQITTFQKDGAVNLGTGIVTGGVITTLEFDGCGNRTKLNSTSMATPNNMNQPTDTGIGHDNSGNLQTYDGWNFSYDAQNRMISATKGSTTATFAYDAKNRQIARSINGVITFSVWDDWELVEEYTTGNVVTAKYLQGAHGPVKSLLNNVYFYQDSLGSTSHIADATGHLLEYYKYDLYGKPTYWNASGGQISGSNPAYSVRDLFSGERWISELGLYDLRNRYYSPDLGRFLQPDPIGFNGDASNLYRYCGNDWANRSDPMGTDGTSLNSKPQSNGQVYQVPGGLWGGGVVRLGPSHTGMSYASLGFSAVHVETKGSPQERVVLGGNATLPKDDPSHFTNEKLKNERGPAAGLTTQNLIPNKDGTVTLKVDLQVRKNLAERDPQLLPREWQHVDRWIAWIGRMNSRNSDLSKKFKDASWDQKTADSIKSFLTRPGQSYFKNEIITQNRDFHQPHGPHDIDYGLTE
jgi:RHS repeat-associated protein